MRVLEKARAGRRATGAAKLVAAKEAWDGTRRAGPTARKERAIDAIEEGN